MLQIRSDQLQALQRDVDTRELVPELLRKLRDADMIPGGEDEADAPSPEERVAKLVEKGREAGIETEDGFLQWVGYGFLVEPGWEEEPEVRALLAHRLDEQALLDELHRILTTR
ncbi:Hypothetical protein A7982_10082 [Minicystis rosea]|nr:Hypothetical protein A7982_10082 [Minicystis rosea]